MRHGCTENGYLRIEILEKPTNEDSFCVWVAKFGEELQLLKLLLNIFITYVSYTLHYKSVPSFESLSGCPLYRERHTLCRLKNPTVI